MFLVIDNYDSFTYNLVQAFYTLGLKPVVLKNDDPALLDLAYGSELEMVCISPGPGHPAKAGFCPQFLNSLNKNVPVLGVCLGHQLLGLHGGAEVDVNSSIFHGKQSEIVHDSRGIFSNLQNPLKVGRYHSLVVKATPASEKQFRVTAVGPEGEIMALQYHDRPWIGVQFHPESVLTPQGLTLLANFPGEIIGSSRKDIPIPVILDKLAAREDLTADMAATGFAALMDGKLTPAQAGAFLFGLRIKGESALELAHATRAALARSVRVKGIQGPAIDIVGTGGDGRNSFNCSTASALIMAAMGYKVIKHGNRAVSSTCGAADAIEALGLPVEPDPKKVLENLEKNNFAFLFAPYYHPAFKNIGPLRKELGVRTLFNILGPMINPARPTHLLMGVARPELVPLVAETLLQSPLQKAAVLCGAGGYDEMTPLGPTEISLIENGIIRKIYFDPDEFGIPKCDPDDLTVHSKEEAVSSLKDILAGKGPRARLDMVALNMAIGIMLLEDDISLKDALQKAQDAVNSGMAIKAYENA